MKTQIVASIFALFLFIHGSLASDQFNSAGDQENTLAYAKQFDSIKANLADKLEIFFYEKKIQSHRDLLAFSITMPTILAVMPEVMHVSVGEALWNEHGDQALNDNDWSFFRYIDETYDGIFKIADEVNHGSK